MSFKDLFSTHAADYKKFRPTYPDILFEFLVKETSGHEAAWDCGTGNGQGASKLAQYFSHVYATDPSAQQLEQAQPMDNVTYKVSFAEKSGLPSQSVSLVTAFQAFHWFNSEEFFKEVRRVLRPNGVLAIIGYNTAISGIEAVDETYKTFCFDYLWEKKCWAMERDGLNSDYSNVEFPFREITTPTFHIEMHWNYLDYLSYLNTWSAVKTHIKLYQENPVKTFVIPKLEQQWPEPEKSRLIQFPLVLRVFRL